MPSKDKGSTAEMATGANEAATDCRFATGGAVVRLDGFETC